MYRPNRTAANNKHAVRQTAITELCNSRRFVDSLTLSCFSGLGVLRAAKAFFYKPTNKQLKTG